MAQADPIPTDRTPPSAGTAPDFLHDLANLLTAISGSLELILSRPNDVKHDRWVRNALEAADLAAQLAAKHHLTRLEAIPADPGAHYADL